MKILGKGWSREDRDRFLKKEKKLMKKAQRIYSNDLLESLNIMSERERQLFIDFWSLFEESFDYIEFYKNQIDTLEDQNKEIIGMLSSTQKMIKELERGHV